MVTTRSSKGAKEPSKKHKLEDDAPDVSSPPSPTAKKRRKLRKPETTTQKNGKAVKEKASEEPDPEDTAREASPKAPKSRPAKTPKTDPEADVRPKYWLMKAEPNTRIENGVDVRFSIDDLAAVTEPEPWEGVRNYVARNNMMAMKQGELAFFYHSNCKVPGIAGIMEVVGESLIDESAFDTKHPYHDPKSNRDKPRWFMVSVRFKRKFDELITLKSLQALGGEADSPLSDMQLLKQSRLSVSKVSKEAWDFIMDLVEQKTEDTKAGIE